MIIVSNDYASAILLISSNDDPGQTAIQTDDPRGFGKPSTRGYRGSRPRCARQVQRRTSRLPLRPPTRLIDCRTVRPPRVSIIYHINIINT